MLVDSTANWCLTCMPYAPILMYCQSEARLASVWCPSSTESQVAVQPAPSLISRLFVPHYQVTPQPLPAENENSNNVKGSIAGQHTSQRVSEVRGYRY